MLPLELGDELIAVTSPLPSVAEALAVKPSKLPESSPPGHAPRSMTTHPHAHRIRRTNTIDKTK
jgi:hypothetical protein